MKILLVEDDEEKSKAIKKQIFNISTDIDEAASFKSAQKKIRSKKYDLILLDMTIPTFDQDYKEKGGKWRSFGGEDLLCEMKRKKKVSKVFVLTGYEKIGSGCNVITLGQLRIKLKKEYPQLFVGMTYFDPFDTTWSDALKRMLKREFKI